MSSAKHLIALGILGVVTVLMGSAAGFSQEGGEHRNESSLNTDDVSTALVDYLVLKTGWDIESKCQRLSSSESAELNSHLKKAEALARAQVTAATLTMLRLAAEATAEKRRCDKDADDFLAELLELGRSIGP